MSLLFYRRPDYLNGGHKAELGGPTGASYVESAAASKPQIPADLAFGEVVKNNTLPPCSLNDFMDYLMYVEYNAEYLQFFLWYCDYVERWSKLPQEERDLAPTWAGTPAKSPKQAQKHARRGSFESQAERFKQILAILEKSTSKSGRSSPSSSSTSSSIRGKNDLVATNFSWPKTQSSDTAHTRTESVLPGGIPSQQPFRDEMDRVTRHYISTDGARQLNLTHVDRAACMDAAASTTHPSALLLAFTVVEDVLKTQCHPNFIRWSVSNCNKPRVVFVRWLSLSLILLGLVVVALLIVFSAPSGHGTIIPAPVRLVASPLWWMGFSLLIASRDGICIILHWNYKRNLRPWEMFADGAVSEDKEDGEEDELGDMSERIYKGASTVSVGTVSSSHSDSKAKAKNKNKSKSKSKSKGRAKADGQKANLRSLGPPNMFDTEPWVDMYESTSWWKRVCDVSITTPNRHLRAVQNRIVLVALICGTTIGAALGVGSVFIPAPRIFF